MDIKLQATATNAPANSQRTLAEHPKLKSATEKDDMLDTWTFAGQTLKAPEMHMPEPLAAAFRPAIASAAKSPPYACDRSQLSVRAVAGGVDEFYIDISLYGGDCIAAVTPLDQDFQIELVNAKEGKYPVTQEQLLKAVYAAKLELEASSSQKK